MVYKINGCVLPGGSARYLLLDSRTRRSARARMVRGPVTEPVIEQVVKPKAVLPHDMLLPEAKNVCPVNGKGAVKWIEVVI